jgi:uncharacterized protein (TIGR03067 family)
MKMKTLSMLIAVLALAATAQNDAGKKELDKLQGAWSVVRLEYSGEEIKSKIRFVLKGDQAVVEADDNIKKEYARIKFKLDPSTMPRIVDVSVADGIQKGTVLEGIYELKADEWKLCIKVIGKERPSEFSAPAGSSNCLVVLKREAP